MVKDIVLEGISKKAARKGTYKVTHRSAISKRVRYQSSLF
jgi:hypothetical protein